MLKNKKVVATIEARMTSSRLPGKVMLESIGKPMLQLMTDRLAGLKNVDEVVIATTVNETDNPIVELAGKLGIKCFRGSEEDVLARVLGAAEENKADVIVELTGDCPLIDPIIVDQVVDLYLNGKCDYATNCLVPSFPLGMETEVFSTNLLMIADREGKTPEDREHVSWFFVRNPQRFVLENIEAPQELTWPDLRLTLDEKADYMVIDAVFKQFADRYASVTCSGIIDFLRKNPQIQDLSKGIVHRGDWSTLAAQTEKIQ